MRDYCVGGTEVVALETKPSYLGQQKCRIYLSFCDSCLDKDTLFFNPITLIRRTMPEYDNEIDIIKKLEMMEIILSSLR